MFVHRKGKGDADTRVLLHVIFRRAVYRRARAEIVGPVHTSPHAATEVVADMRLHRVDRILLKGVAAEKIVIIGEESHAGGEFQLEFPDRFGDSEARLEGPAVRPNVYCFAGVVLAKGSGHLKTRSDDNILLIAPVLFHGERGSSVEVDREPEQGIPKASHITFHRLSFKQGGSR